ncbi:Sip7p [Datura stramonium]|uniref:Sip7p n=1 Tax=Datura stramonium TaxID=4076 RepID=A0ABS8RSM9_DATST|nr:Sip7p [Datura stramonium]
MAITLLFNSGRTCQEVQAVARRHVAASLMQHHRSIERTNHAIQPVSPASYGSSMEIAPIQPCSYITSSIDLKGDHARVWIKELMRDQQVDRHEIDELMKQITEDKVVRKSKGKIIISAAIQSVRDELEDERKLEKQESLHRRLARELYETKMEPQYGQGDKSSIIEKFRSEIETFLKTKQTGIRNNVNIGDPTYRRGSLDSIPLNVAGSAPQDEGDDDDSVSSDSHCFELQKPSAADLKSMRMVKFEEHMARAALPSETGRGGSSGKKNKADGTPGVNSNYMIDELIRSHYLLSESGNMPPENDYELASYGTSVRRAQASPVRQWTEKLPSHENISESSTKLPPNFKENTLKAKLMEAEQGVNVHGHRWKGTKISF